MWVESVDDLTYDLEEDGTLVRRQLDRVVLARGAWATVLFLYEELDRATGQFRAPKISVTRFRKLRGAYRKHSAFDVPNAARARELTDVLSRWATRMAADGDDLDDGADDAREEG